MSRNFFNGMTLICNIFFPFYRWQEATSGHGQLADRTIFYCRYSCGAAKKIHCCLRHHPLDKPWPDFPHWLASGLPMEKMSYSYEIDSLFLTIFVQRQNLGQKSINSLNNWKKFKILWWFWMKSARSMQRHLQMIKL